MNSRRMYELMPFPLSAGVLAEYGGGEGLRAHLKSLDCQGVEAIWAGEPVPEEFPRELAVGWHLTFFTDWLDLYREDKKNLLEKYGTLEEARRFYGGLGADYLLEVYRADLERAKAVGAKYVVFHVSDVSIEEGYTYRWRHGSKEVIDAAAEIVNTLMGEKDDSFDFLLENLWWPGLTMTDPELTGRLLESVRCPKKGLMLDTGHLMNANQELTTQREGVDCIHRMLDAHGDLCRYIRGLHLHQSVSGDYVRKNTGFLPPDLPRDSVEQYGVNYGHIQKIDRHEPWTIPEAASIVERLRPDYLTHELSAKNAAERKRAVLRQRRALGFAEEAKSVL